MTTTYFGPRWDAPLLDDPDDGSPAPVQIATPAGVPCYVCSTPIHDGERGLQRVGYGADGPQTLHVHTECEMLGVIGHAHGVCSCTGWDTTSRAAALELLRVINERRFSTGQGPL